MDRYKAAVMIAFIAFCVIGAYIDSSQRQERYKTCIQAGHAPKDCP